MIEYATKKKEDGDPYYKEYDAVFTSDAMQYAKSIEDGHQIRQTIAIPTNEDFVLSEQNLKSIREAVSKANFKSICDSKKVTECLTQVS